MQERFNGVMASTLTAIIWTFLFFKVDYFFSITVNRNVKYFKILQKNEKVKFYFSLLN